MSRIPARITAHKENYQSHFTKKGSINQMEIKLTEERYAELVKAAGLLDFLKDICRKDKDFGRQDLMEIIDPDYKEDEKE